MLITFILGLVAGWFAPKAEHFVKDAIESIHLSDPPLSEAELRLVSFAACVLAAAVLSMILGNPHAGVLAIGALLGVLAPRLQDKWRKSRNPDYDE